MAGQTEQSELLTDVILEDKIADIWPDYQCLYDVTSPDFKNRDLRQKSYEEMAEKLEKSGNTSFSQFQSIWRCDIVKALIIWPYISNFVL